MVYNAVPDLKNRSAIHVVSAYMDNKIEASQVSHAKSLPRTSEPKPESTPNAIISMGKGHVKNSLRDNREIKEWLENGTYDYKIRVQCRCIIR